MTDFDEDDIAETPLDIETIRDALIKRFKPGIEIRDLPCTPGFNRPGMCERNVVRYTGVLSDKGGTTDYISQSK